MRTDTGPEQTPTRLADYRPPDWLVDDVHLVFDLAAAVTLVRARIRFRRNPARAAEGSADLRLEGRKLTLRCAALDGQPLAGSDLALDREGLTVPARLLPGERFLWECDTEIDPSANTELEGLYISKGMFCTQCEAEGFRKITYYPDRPDVMAPFTVRIEADVEACPVLLSNGNPGERGALPGGRHFAEWYDPWPKPSYLFALVAGTLVAHEDGFTTASGRAVALKLWVRPGDEGKCTYAMAALKRAMAWDEETHGCEYDLDLFQIVAVDDFNMGAMENKGLNIFNSKYVLASPETATDQDYANIEAIVAHEYFHNWTGNRITCRDWFQLCLKEGLTVFRDQWFSSDLRSRAVERIGQARALRQRQFPEDQGPLAHPVRPEEYIEVNNFYSATVYEKGAEVIAMLRRLVGAEGYRAALDLYFERHDGQACTIEDFRACFEDATGRDLGQFARWWHQAGTPRIAVSEDWDGERLTVTLAQSTPPTPGQPEKRPLHIPFAVGIVAPDGSEIRPTVLLELTEAEQSVRFDLRAESAGADAKGRPVPSLNRGFSAPVIVARDTTDAERALLIGHDTDPFARWEAGRTYAMAIATGLAHAGGKVPEAWSEALGRVIADEALEPAYRSLMLGLPGVDELVQALAAEGRPADPLALHTALTEMRRALATRLADPLAALYDAMDVPGPYSPDPESAGRRSLRNRAMALLCATCEDAAFARAEHQFETAGNMSEMMPALAALVHEDAPSAAHHLDAFYGQWRDTALVVDKWLAVQATAPVADASARVAALTDHPAFDWRNPNKFRALIGAFAMQNPIGFHSEDGAGYRLVANWLLHLDAANPQTAARIASAFESWRCYDRARQGRIRAELERIASAESLSRNTREIVERTLAGDPA